MQKPISQRSKTWNPSCTSMKHSAHASTADNPVQCRLLWCHMFQHYSHFSRVIKIFVSHHFGRWAEITIKSANQLDNPQRNLLQNAIENHPISAQTIRQLHPQLLDQLTWRLRTTRSARSAEDWTIWGVSSISQLWLGRGFFVGRSTWRYCRSFISCPLPLFFQHSFIDFLIQPWHWHDPPRRSDVRSLLPCSLVIDGMKLSGGWEIKWKATPGIALFRSFTRAIHSWRLQKHTVFDDMTLLQSDSSLRTVEFNAKN